MTALDPATDPGELPLLLTVEEAALLLRIGRSHGYEMAGEYLGNGGTSVLPVIRLSRGSLRVRRSDRRGGGHGRPRCRHPALRCRPGAPTLRSRAAGRRRTLRRAPGQ